MARILIVDDDPDILECVGDWLAHEQHAVTVASTSADGWSQLQNNVYDVVVLDWELPDGTGIDLLTRFRESGGATPIIMLTGHNSLSDKETGLDSGANDFLTKPFFMKELAARIRAHVKAQERATAPPPPLGQGNEEVLKRGDLLGTRLAADYEFIDVLDEGGAAFVFRARHPRWNKVVAIKMLKSTELNKAQLEHCARQASTVSQINHNNIAAVYDYGVTERNRPYLVTEYVEGESLIDKIRREGPLPLTLACMIAIQICKVLQDLHSKAIICRNLKSQDIVLPERDKPDCLKIVDFGTTHPLEEDEGRLEAAGTVKDTDVFMAPEQLRGAPADARSNIYSLGAILFEALTARPVFTDEDVDRSHVNVHARGPEPPSCFRKDIASDLDRVVLKALDNDPNKRYQTATEMRLALEHIYNGLLLRRS